MDYAMRNTKHLHDMSYLVKNIQHIHLLLIPFQIIFMLFKIYIAGMSPLITATLCFLIPLNVMGYYYLKEMNARIFAQIELAKYWSTVSEYISKKSRRKNKAL